MNTQTEYLPSPVPENPPAGLRVVRSFTCEGVRFLEGEFAPAKDPLVRRIWTEYPGLFELVGNPY